MAIYRLHLTLLAAKGICAPNGVTRNQLFDIIIPKLMHAPDLLELDAVSVVDALLRKAYPCN
jgi:hypothetical protein